MLGYRFPLTKYLLHQSCNLNCSCNSLGYRSDPNFSFPKLNVFAFVDDFDTLEISFSKYGS